MILADRAVLDGLSHQRQLGRCRRAAELTPRPDPRSKPHAAFDLPGRDAQSRPQPVQHRGHEPDLIGRIRKLTEHPKHQATVGALLSLQPLRQLHPKRIADPVRGQCPHFVVSGVNLIQQLTNPLTSCVSGNEVIHTARIFEHTYARSSPATPASLTICG